jgi:hypothetical protein
VLEFFERLAAKVAAVHEKEPEPGSGLLDEPMDEIASGVGLAAAAANPNSRSKSGSDSRTDSSLPTTDKSGRARPLQSSATGDRHHSPVITVTIHLH